MTHDMTAFSVSVVDTPTGPVVTPHGEIDMATADDLERVAVSAIGSAHVSLTIDLSDVDFCDSAGLNAFVKIRKICNSAGQRFAISGAKTHIFQVFAISGLVEFLNVTHTADASAAGDSQLHH
jgi:anti-sigma B factor antagonist